MAEARAPDPRRLGRHAGARPIRGDGEPVSQGLSDALTSLEAAVNAGGLGVWRWDAATGTVEWSPRMEEIYGFEPGRFPRTYGAYLACIHPDDREAAKVNFTDRSRERDTLTYLYRIIRQDGEVRWLEGAGQPLVDEHGEVIGAAGACMDVTERMLAAQYDSAEVAVTRLLAESADEADVLARLVELLGLTLPLDVVALWTPSSTGALSLRHTWSARPSKLVLATQDLSADDEVALPRRASASMAPVVVADLAEERNLRRRQAALDDGLRWAGAFPIVVADEIEGVLECFGAAKGPAKELCEALTTIGSQTGLFLGRARALEAMAASLRERARVAELLQQSLLPPTLPAVPGLDAAARYEAGTELVGGDFYDLFPLAGGEWGVAIGDVCGKGPEAATLTGLLRHSLRTAAILDPSPVQVLDVTNAALLRADADGRFASAVYGWLRPTERGVVLRLAGAGHPPPLVLRANGAVEAVPPSGRLLGLFDTVDSAPHDLELVDGDTLVLYTDGITEARRGRELFDTERLAALLASRVGTSAERLADDIVSAVAEFADGEDRDDRAIIVLRAAPGRR